MSPEDQALRRTFLSSLLSAFRHGHAWDLGEEVVLTTVLKTVTWETSAFSASMFPAMPSLASSPVASPQPGAVFPGGVSGGVAAAGGGGGMMVNWNFAAVVFGLRQGHGRGGRPEFSKSAIQCERKLKTKPELLDDSVVALPRPVHILDTSKISPHSAKDLLLSSGVTFGQAVRPPNLPPHAFLALERRGAITRKSPIVSTALLSDDFRLQTASMAIAGWRRRGVAERLVLLESNLEKCVNSRDIMALDEKVRSGLVECMIEKKRVTSLTSTSLAFGDLVHLKTSPDFHVSVERLIAVAAPTLQAAEDLVKGPAPKTSSKKPGRADRILTFHQQFSNRPPLPSPTPSSVAGTSSSLLGLISQAGSVVATSPVPIPAPVQGQSPRPTAATVNSTTKRKVPAKSEGGLSIAALNSSLNSSTAKSPSFAFKQPPVPNPPNFPPMTIPPVQMPQAGLPPLPATAGSSRPTRRATLVKKEKN
jgi:hypothetical protein